MSPPTLSLAGVSIDGGRTVHIRVADGLIDTVVDADAPVPTADQTRRLDGWWVGPSAVEPHAHLDKTLTTDSEPNPSGDLFGAIEAWERQRARFDHDDAVARAVEGIARAVSAGVTHIRTHVDVTETAGLRPLAAVVEARTRMADVATVEIVALSLDPLSGSDPAGRRRLEAALDQGADIVGGCPNLDDDPVGATREAVAIARANDRRIDLHADETLDPEARCVEALADAVAGWGQPGRVVASHAVRLSMEGKAAQATLAARLAAAGVAVVTLPQTNLSLQARGIDTAPPRGLTAIAALRRAGVTVAAGGDNVQDPFNALGRSDPFETVALLMAAGHLLPVDAWAAVTREARAAIGAPPVAVEAGAPADLVAVRARTLDEAIASAPPDRVVLRGGAVVAETRSERTVDPRPRP